VRKLRTDELYLLFILVLLGTCILFTEASRMEKQWPTIRVAQQRTVLVVSDLRLL
jgi:hypothetical protein